MNLKKHQKKHQVVDDVIGTPILLLLLSLLFLPLPHLLYLNPLPPRPPPPPSLSSPSESSSLKLCLPPKVEHADVAPPSLTTRRSPSSVVSLDGGRHGILITSAHLAAADSDSPAERLQFSVLAAPRFGHLENQRTGEGGAGCEVAAGWSGLSTVSPWWLQAPTSRAASPRRTCSSGPCSSSSRRNRK